MEGSNPLHPQQQQQQPSPTYGETANALARLGRPLPSPFAHFSSPIAPYTLPNFSASVGPASGAQHHHPHHQHQQQPPSASASSMFADPNSPLHSTLVAAYSTFDSLFHSSFNNFASLLMNPNATSMASLTAAGLHPPLFSAFPTNVHPHRQQQQPHSGNVSPCSPTSTSSSSPNYFRAEAAALASEAANTMLLSKLQNGAHEAMFGHSFASQASSTAPSSPSNMITGHGNNGNGKKSKSCVVTDR